ncbi:hypothetical protein [Priestia megaterium]|uniref:hypothetical protein n=1 Tax=Priestia megaterium TaxID=1404 RepID=UPI0020409157|nr:hypothetical protein [Priestia megaterium]MCM3307016.1 hypothetical protein [Priestia megaterium]
MNGSDFFIDMVSVGFMYIAASIWTRRRLLRDKQKAKADMEINSNIKSNAYQLLYRIDFSLDWIDLVMSQPLFHRRLSRYGTCLGKINKHISKNGLMHNPSSNK